MMPVPVLPNSAPFTNEQRAWLNGYLAGLFARGPVNPAVAGAARVHATAVPAATTLTPLTILFGSQTGTAEALARRVAKEAGKRGFAATAVDMAQTDLGKLAAEKHVLVLTSTYGDGEPPDNAKPLHAALTAAAAQPNSQLASLRYSVCAFGDTNYTQFCKCGADFDRMLETLGGRRVAPRVDCDLDYEAKFSAWFESALSALTADGGTAAAAAPPVTASTPAIAAESGYSRSSPYSALVAVSRALSGAGSAKCVHHVEFALGDSGLVYEAGDALGVVPHNCHELVADVLSALGCDGEEAVPAPNGTAVPLRRALTEFYDLGKPPAELLAHFGGSGGGVAVALPHVIDVLQARADIKLAPADFVRSLRKLQPRLYSISSSPRAYPNRVHLTVGAVRYEHAGRARKGVCSTFLADRVVPGEARVGIFVHQNKAFRPPPRAELPLIMIGPGTGIAPFRAFLQERGATAAGSRNWLFFGDQRAATDFLYRDELLAFRDAGTLTRLDLAWSRDQADKIYVQHRMLEHAVELFAWLEAGAHVAVCGDASRMAKDVDAALHRIIERAGGRTPEQAAAYIQSLQAGRRYVRDVY